MKNLTYNLILLVIILFSFFIRFYNLDKVPPGLHADEASQGYNAYSILKTGKDMYGKAFPVLFRANGSYQLPIYTYLTTVPVLIFGTSILALRFTSAISGVLLVLITFKLVEKLGIGSQKERRTQGLFSSAIVAISPWAIHFSRFAAEANLSVLIFVLSVYLFIVSLKKKYAFIFACILLGISSHTYYSEQIISLFFIFIFVIVFRKVLLQKKAEVLVGIFLFILCLIPHLIIVKTGALTSRFTQVSYLGNASLHQGNLLDKAFNVGGEFLDHYLAYFSPKNLFFDPGSYLGRVGPDLSAFYPWFVVFYLLGLGYLFKRRHWQLGILVIILLAISPVPASFTGDAFNLWRILVFLWTVSMIISYGAYEIWVLIKNDTLRLVIFLGILTYSIFSFRVSYFVLSKYENPNLLSYSYTALLDELGKVKDKKVLLDHSSRTWGVGIIMTYLKGVDPIEVQKNMASQVGSDYYGNSVVVNEVYKIDNIIIRSLDWGEVCGEAMVVGDKYTVSQAQFDYHKLYQTFTLNDITGAPALFGYKTNKKCDPN
jgi:4-amino-4-deoxy-L-arabinose transferase-like glycosyltransferase